MSDFFKFVSRDVASNPVARALAKRRIESAIRDFLLELYFLEDGAEQRENYLAAARVLAVAIRLVEMKGIDLMGPMRGALSCCQQASERGFKWRRLDAVAIDTGLCAALEVINAASASEVQRAWAFVMDLERAAA
ncbi:MAG: hypothetical protein RL227_1407 [Pseudomonadota bacterium]